jgi:hypothetical protein
VDERIDGGALEQLVDDMGSDAPGKDVIRDLRDAACLAQDLVGGDAEKGAEELEMLDSQSCPAAQDVAEGPMADAEEAFGFALRDPGFGEALPQDLDDGGFERAVPNVQRAISS